MSCQLASRTDHDPREHRGVRPRTHPTRRGAHILALRALALGLRVALVHSHTVSLMHSFTDSLACTHSSSTMPSSAGSVGRGAGVVPPQRGRQLICKLRRRPGGGRHRRGATRSAASTALPSQPLCAAPGRAGPGGGWDRAAAHGGGPPETREQVVQPVV